jgi:hypothetical protein
MTTFALMKRKRKILLNMIFLSLILIMIGTNASSNFYFQIYGIEHTDVIYTSENNLTPDYNFLNDDQIDTTYKLRFPEEFKTQMTIQGNNTILYYFSLPLLQPPKIA